MSLQSQSGAVSQRISGELLASVCAGILKKLHFMPASARADGPASRSGGKQAQSRASFLQSSIEMPPLWLRFRVGLPTALTRLRKSLSCGPEILGFC